MKIKKKNQKIGSTLNFLSLKKYIKNNKKNLRIFKKKNQKDK